MSSFNSTSKRMSLYLPLLFTILLEPRHCNKRYNKSICHNTPSTLPVVFPFLEYNNMLSIHIHFTLAVLFPQIQIVPSFASISSLVRYHLFIRAFTDNLMKNINKPSLYLSPSLYLLYFILESYLKYNIFLYHIFLPIKYKLLEVRECLLDSP